MKNHVCRVSVLVLVLWAIFALSSCGLFKSSKRPPEASYIKGGINFHLRGDNHLNIYQRVPHALILCAYQMRDANAFNQLLEEKDGISKLMECGRFDASVTFAKRLIVQPGQDVYEAMEKTEGSKYIAIVAGFYNFQKRSAIKLIPLPMRGMPMFRKPGGIDLSLYLTDTEIRNLTEGK